ncbi:MAG: 6-carboxy-5,6,7,8-tetrahydropterin synthase [bacterium]|nr:MAG: 6-carboxy-5,6,7,8-tetrahydropterin synthase [bacterium]
MMYEITVKKSFSSAHFLRDHKGPCKNVHGHNWMVEASFASVKLDDLGMVVDFEDASKELSRVTCMLDHKLINEVPPFDVENPTAEKIAEWIFVQLEKNLPVTPSRVTVFETDSSSASYAG